MSGWRPLPTPGTEGCPCAVCHCFCTPSPAVCMGQQAAGLPLGIAKMVGNGIVGAGVAVPCHTGAVTVGVGIAMLGRVGAASSGGRTDGEEGMAT